MTSKNKDGRSKGVMSKTGADLAMRGNAGSKNYWHALMPNARKKAVEMGIFTPDGAITEKGMQMLSDLDSSEAKDR